MKGVCNVEQGFITSTEENNSFSEAVILYYDSDIISLQVLIEIHLRTHKSTSAHSMRDKYRSAIYYFLESQKIEAKTLLQAFQPEFGNQLITKVYPFSEFKASREAIQNYYQKSPEKPFCERFINPKLRLLLKSFSNYIDTDFIPKTLQSTSE